MSGATDHLMPNARGLAKLGWYVLPVRAKIPTSPHGLLDATNDPDALERLFSAYPGDGIAVDCGRSGLVVLDLDLTPVVDGRDSAREAGLPYLTDETPRALTPRGGSHVFYAGRTASRTGVLAGVDVKSMGGYVVVPPGTGRCWEADASPFDVPVAPAPPWLLALAGPRPGNGSPRWEAALEDYVGEGQRNDTAASIAGKLVYHHVPDRLVVLLTLAWCRSFCRPPLPDKEALVVVRSVLQKASR